MKDKKIVVTGGAGFIGSHIVDALLKEGANVVVIDNLSTGRRENIEHNLEKIKFFETDIVDTGALTEIFQGASAVVHQAAMVSVPRSIEAPMESHNTNSTGTLSVFTAAKNAGVERVVFATSSSVYGNSPTLPKVETMAPNPLSPYAVQKLTGELYSKVFNNLFGLKTIGLRYFNVFGPRQNPNSAYAAVIPRFINLIKQGQIPQINGDGEHTRDFTFVENVVNANLLALKTNKGFGEIYNTAANVQISLNTLVKKINEFLGTSIPPQYLPPRAGDIKDSFADINKAKEILGYEVKVDFEEGLKRTIESLK
jgi:nucleoside-diphosphate-sugar epimerase